MSRRKSSDAFVLFPARYHSSQNGDVKWLPLSVLYVSKNEMGCADAFRCLMGDVSVKVPLHALRCRYSKSILFLLLIHGRYFLGLLGQGGGRELGRGCGGAGTSEGATGDCARIHRPLPSKPRAR